MYDAMMIGAIEMGRTGSLIISVAAPQYGALDLPYVFRSQQHLRNVLAGPIAQTMHQEFLARRGIRVLGIVNRGPRHLTTRNRAVRTPADLAGLKVRVPEIPVYVAAWRALGASPTPMAFPEVFTALQQGTIDGQENPLATIHGNSFQDVQRFLVLTAHVRGNGWMIASERFWQSLTAADRTLLQQAVNDASAYADAQIARQEDELLAALRGRMEVVSPDIRAFADIVLRDVPARFADRWKPGLVEQILNTAG
jgi:tripartite ATP-independent transporter DctP family solute receptor